MTTRTISYDRATEMLRQPGYVLLKMFVGTKRGKEYFIIGRHGGAVTAVTAGKLLQHPLIREVDSGLFPGIPQSYTLWHGRKAGPRPSVGKAAP